MDWTQRVERSGVACWDCGLDRGTGAFCRVCLAPAVPYRPELAPVEERAARKLGHGEPLGYVAAVAWGEREPVYRNLGRTS